MAEQDPAPNAPTSDEQAEPKPEQTVTIEDVGPARKKLTIELPESRISEKIEETFAQLRDETNLPGFRRGRAPRRLLERRFGSELRNDVKTRLLSEAYSQAVDDYELDVLGEPDVKDADQIELPESGSMKFEAEIEVAPNVTLPAYDSLAVEKPSATVTDEDLEQELERYRLRMGKTESVADATLEADDFVVGAVKVYAGHDEPAEDAELILDRSDVYIMVPGESREFRGHVAGIIVDDLGKQIIGKQAGETVTLQVTGPKSHENEQIKDQPITIRVALDRVERHVPASMEEVIEQTGLESEQDLRDRMRGMLEQRSVQRQKQEMHQQVCDQLVEKVELELPEGLTSQQTERLVQRQAMQLQQQGVEEHEVEQKLAELRASSEEDARRGLKLFFILDQAARDLDIEVNENELNREITMMAVQQGRRPEKLRQEMQQRGHFEQLYMQIREQKTLDQILEKATVTDKAPEADKKAGKGKTSKKKED